MTLTQTETRTLTTRKGRAVTTSLSDERAYEICRSLRSTFAQDLTSRSLHRLSSEQMIWCHILAVESITPQASPLTVPIGSFMGINALFQKAGFKLKYPAIVLMTEDGIDVKISLAGSSAKYAGQVYVREDGKAGRYFGRVDKAGEFHPTRDSSPSIAALLQKFGEDPAGMAAAYGQMSGRCCFCADKLTDEKSVAVGYGPQCARNYQLPYGVQAARDAKLKLAA